MDQATFRAQLTAEGFKEMVRGDICIRTGEKIAMSVSTMLRPLVPVNYRSVAAADVARALLRRVSLTQGKEVLLSGAMQPR